MIELLLLLQINEKKYIIIIYELTLFITIVIIKFAIHF